MIVEGGLTIRFCPLYPQIIPQFASIRDTLNFCPKEFFALNMESTNPEDIIVGDTHIDKYPIDEAYKDGTLNKVGSTYSPKDDTIHDGVSRQGTYLFTLAPVLKYKLFPFAEIIQLLLGNGFSG